MERVSDNRQAGSERRLVQEGGKVDARTREKDLRSMSAHGMELTRWKRTATILLFGRYFVCSLKTGAASTSDDFSPTTDISEDGVSEELMRWSIL